jgi:hypothetical protein
MGSRAKPDLSAARTLDRRCGDISLVILVFQEKVPIKKEVRYQLSLEKPNRQLVIDVTMERLNQYVATMDVITRFQFIQIRISLHRVLSNHG